MRLNKTLLTFATIHIIVSFFLLQKVFKDESGSLGIGYFFVFFWLVSGAILLALFIRKLITINTHGDKILLLFSTPIPIILIFISIFFSKEPRGGERQYIKNDYTIREIDIMYRFSDNIKRKEFYRNMQPNLQIFPVVVSNGWVKDSIWVYYDNTGNIIKTTDFRKN